MFLQKLRIFENQVVFLIVSASKLVFGRKPQDCLFRLEPNKQRQDDFILPIGSAGCADRYIDRKTYREMDRQIKR